MLGGLYKKIKKRFYSYNLRKKLVVIMFSAVLTTFAFCIVLFAIFNYTAQKNATESMLASSKQQKSDALISYMQTLDNTAFTIMFSNWTQQYLMLNKSATPGDKQLYQRNISHFLNSLAIIHNNVTFALISNNEIISSDNNNNNYNRNFSIKDQIWFSNLRKYQNYIQYGSDGLFNNNGIWSMTVYYPVTSYYDFSVIGYLAINVKSSNMSFLINDDTEQIQVLDPKQNTVISNTNSFDHDPVEMFIGSVDELSEGKWSIRLNLRQKTDIVGQIQLYGMFLLLLLPIVIVFVIIVLRFSQYLTKPILECRDALLQIRNNHFGVMVKNYYLDEISELIDGLNEMSGALVTLLKQNEAIDNLRRDTEFEMLQEKVNPHFLFNTLEVINSLILSTNTQQAVAICETLGQMYHYNLSTKKWVALRDEIEYVRQYLNIIQYQKSLEFYVDVEPEAQGISVLKILLQPLVENSIRYGYGKKLGEICITITAKIVDGIAEIIVMDNGYGITEDVLSRIRRNLDHVKKGYPQINNSHIGIRNVYQRLYLEFKNQLSFRIESQLGFGTKITINIPKVLLPE